mmetsp:Transcript_12029/g.36133  ORF Transcript_12029/g.36133 Transcript_12029/m.36133 type:complete len:208 (-) Transcript_12029:365-988(-)
MMTSTMCSRIPCCLITVCSRPRIRRSLPATRVSCRIQGGFGHLRSPRLNNNWRIRCVRRHCPPRLNGACMTWMPKWRSLPRRNSGQFHCCCCSSREILWAGPVCLTEGDSAAAHLLKQLCSRLCQRCRGVSKVTAPCGPMKCAVLDRINWTGCLCACLTVRHLGGPWQTGLACAGSLHRCLIVCRFTGAGGKPVPSRAGAFQCCITV